MIQLLGLPESEGWAGPGHPASWVLGAVSCLQRTHSAAPLPGRGGLGVSRDAGWALPRPAEAGRSPAGVGLGKGCRAGLGAGARALVPLPPILRYLLG